MCIQVNILKALSVIAMARMSFLKKRAELGVQLKSVELMIFFFLFLLLRQDIVSELIDF